jgi:hypothetical protein
MHNNTRFYLSYCNVLYVSGVERVRASAKKLDGGLATRLSLLSM